MAKKIFCLRLSPAFTGEKLSISLRDRALQSLFCKETIRLSQKTSYIVVDPNLENCTYYEWKLKKSHLEVRSSGDASCFIFFCWLRL